MSEFILDTERLYLRTFKKEDAGHMYAMNLDKDVIINTGDIPFNNPEEAQDFISDYVKTTDEQLCRWTVILKSTNEYLGWCGLKLEKEKNQVDLGFRFLKQHRNKGYATEASLACLKHGFRTLNLKKIIGRSRTINTSSIRVLQKIGMHYDKQINYLGGDSVQYALSAQDYAKITDK
jgi:RimJ/RimL family protein N-acetyltransferase